MEQQEASEPKKRKKLKRIEGFNDVRALNCSCFRNQRFLVSDRACGWVVDAIEMTRAKHGFHLWAWCIMPTHVHIMILPSPGWHACCSEQACRSTGWHACASAQACSYIPVSTTLSTLKQSVAKRAVLWAKRECPVSLALMLDEQPNGSRAHRFWQRGGGYDRNLFTSDAIWDMIHYIHLNPVRDGLCKRAEDWPWSSAMTFRDKATGRLRIDAETLHQLR